MMFHDKEQILHQRIAFGPNDWKHLNGEGVARKAVYLGVSNRLLWLHFFH